jgi:hypothetical protein
MVGEGSDAHARCPSIDLLEWKKYLSSLCNSIEAIGKAVQQFSMTAGRNFFDSHSPAISVGVLVIITSPVDDWKYMHSVRDYFTSSKIETKPKKVSYSFFYKEHVDQVIRKLKIGRRACEMKLLGYYCASNSLYN